MDANPRRFFRFGVFEADERTGELRKQGRRLALRGQPLQVLFMLLNRPGELVTRAEMQQRLWPDGTFVDFDHSVNSAVNKVRDVLGDSAESPRFVETLARRGYRFIAPVDVMDPASAGLAESRQQFQRSPVPPSSQAMAHEDQARKPWSIRHAGGLLTRADEMPQVSRPLVRWLFLLLQAMYLCFYAISLARLSIVEDVIHGMVLHPLWPVVLLVLSAMVGIPTRLYLISAVAFNAPSLRENFLRIFPVLFSLDELWSLAPFLLVHQIGFGLAMGATAALLYAPFAQRSLILMGGGESARAKHNGA